VHFSVMRQNCNVSPTFRQAPLRNSTAQENVSPTRTLIAKGGARHKTGGECMAELFQECGGCNASPPRRADVNCPRLSTICPQARPLCRMTARRQAEGRRCVADKRVALRHASCDSRSSKHKRGLGWGISDQIAGRDDSLKYKRWGALNRIAYLFIGILTSLCRR
jgi:hypothetical protein